MKQKFIPPMDEPFKRVASDIVGPLNRTKRGHKFILVICDYATKYPEAMPLKSIDSESVAIHLAEWGFQMNCFLIKVPILCLL